MPPPQRSTGDGSSRALRPDLIPLNKIMYLPLFISIWKLEYLKNTILSVNHDVTRNPFFNRKQTAKMLPVPWLECLPEDLIDLACENAICGQKQAAGEDKEKSAKNYSKLFKIKGLELIYC